MADLMTYLKNLAVRPLLPGEKRDNKDGTYSTQLGATEYETEKPGSPVMNVPTLWSVDGQYVELPYGLSVDLALGLEQKLGIKFPRYSNLEEGAAASKAESAAGGGTIGQFLLDHVRKMDEARRSMGGATR